MREVSKIACRVEDLCGLRKRQTVNDTTRQGRMEKGREWRMQQPSDPQGLVSRPLLSVLHFACNSLVSYFVCNLPKEPCATAHLSHPSTSQATNKTAYQLQTPYTRPTLNHSKHSSEGTRVLKDGKNVKITTRLGHLRTTSRQRHTTRTLEKGSCQRTSKL